MKGKLILVPVGTPIEGMKVVWNGKILYLNGQNDPGGSDHWYYGTKTTNEGLEPWEFLVTQLKQISIKYSSTGMEKPNPEHIITKEELYLLQQDYKSTLKTIPLHPDNYEEAIPYIDHELGFTFVHDKSCAKLILPTPVRTIEDIPEELRHMYPKNFNGIAPEVTKQELAELLLEIQQYHPKTGDIIYFQDDLLKLFNKLRIFIV